jgi:hypothetical protein
MFVAAISDKAKPLTAEYANVWSEAMNVRDLRCEYCPRRAYTLNSLQANVNDIMA